MNTIELNTGLFVDVLDVGSYGAWDEFCVDSINELIPDILNIGQYSIMDIMTSTFNNINFKLSCFKFHSPKYYNYENDVIVFNLTYDETMLEYIEKNINDDFIKFIQNRYKSRDGFISFMPNNKESFFESLYSDNPFRAISCYIVWRCWDNDIYQNAFDEAIYNTDTYFKYCDLLEV